MNDVKEYTAEQLQAAASVLEATGQYKILRKLKAREAFSEDDGSKKEILMVVDTETTGVDSKKDKVFEIGYVMVEFNAESGKIFRVIDRVSELQDPGFPLPQEIIEITGVNDEDLKGKKFDRQKIESDIAKADLIIAHNSNFDRKFLEREFSSFANKSWICSLDQGPWDEMHIGTKKLEFIAYAVGGIFYEAHRALTDTEALLEILSKSTPSGTTVLKSIHDKGFEPSFTVWALGSSFDTKDKLKANGYRWSDGSDPDGYKSWYKMGVRDLDAELAFLGREIYSRRVSLPVDFIHPMEAFSGRYTERQTIEVSPPPRVSP